MVFDNLSPLMYLDPQVGIILLRYQKLMVSASGWCRGIIIHALYRSYEISSGSFNDLI
jgi:hypothetical protein